jgi:hypothetical protein
MLVICICDSWVGRCWYRVWSLVVEVLRDTFLNSFSVLCVVQVCDTLKQVQFFIQFVEVICGLGLFRVWFLMGRLCMLGYISRSHGGEFEGDCLLGCCTV